MRNTFAGGSSSSCHPIGEHAHGGVRANHVPVAIDRHRRVRLMAAEKPRHRIMDVAHLGIVEAPDQREAYRLAIEKFEIPIERQNRLFVVKQRPRQGRAL